MATTRTTSNRSVLSWLFIVAGVLVLLNILFAHVAPKVSGAWWDFFAFVALAVAFLLLFLWRTVTLLRVAFIVAAVGWAVHAISLVANLGSGIDKVALVLALVGGLVAGIIVFMRHVFTRNADLAFLIAMIVGAIYLLGLLVAFLSGTLATIVAILFAVLLVVSGFLIQRHR